MQAAKAYLRSPVKRLVQLVVLLPLGGLEGVQIGSNQGDRRSVGRGFTNRLAEGLDLPPAPSNHTGPDPLVGGGQRAFGDAEVPGSATRFEQRATPGGERLVLAPELLGAELAPSINEKRLLDLGHSEADPPPSFDDNEEEEHDAEESGGNET